MNRVLLVEDSPTQAEHLRQLLEKDGLEVVPEATAESALEHLETAHPNMIIVDYHLPGMDGYEFCREIRQKLNTRAIPILMLTVERSDAAEMRGLESGADDYLPKSVDPDILLVRVHSLLRKAESSGAAVDIETRFQRARILIVDHSPTFLHMLGRELEAEHYRVEKATTGIGGLERMRERAFDCVLVDFELPDVNGAELSRRFAALQREGAAAVVIILTSHDDKGRLMLGLESGADDFISKSADIALVKARIRALLRRKFFIEENRRIIDELREKELEAVRARSEKEAAELRATMAERLAVANRELEAANQKLQEALSLTKAITENAADVLLMVDCSGLVTFMNPAAQREFGFPADELLGHRLDQRLRFYGPNGALLEGPDYPVNRCLTTATRTTGVDGIFLCRSGDEIDVAASIAPISQNGVVSSAVVILHNLTERKRTEERLRQKQKLESIGLLAGGIAHDFNNILVGVLGNASFAQDLLRPGTQIHSILDRIIDASQHAAHLTRQMLAYSGQGRFVVEPVDLSKLVPEFMKLVEGSIPAKVNVRLQLADALPPVMADAAQMQQVIVNLVLNAVEAIGDRKGTITIRTGLSQPDARCFADELNRSGLPTGECVYLQVEDTGCGMDAATKARMFDPFFTTKFTGRGLGLAAVAGVVRGHHGAICVETNPGLGSSFRVLLPVSAESIPPVVAPPRLTASTRRNHAGQVILVVDDEPVVLQAATQALTAQGYTVLQADSGPKAVELLRQQDQPISLVLLDLRMPGMDGPETLAKMREIRPDLEVVISSGYGETETRAFFEGKQISGFIQKPYTASGIAAVVEAALERPSEH
ncbi:MAG TPA: response regulator [Bryobacteraceae bacterium]|nr:response regulator [Bryobacteraceae bacterium]